jgi:hypothetical protein
MGVAKELFWPPIVELLSLDTSAIVPNRCEDLSRSPEDQ